MREFQVFQPFFEPEPQRGKRERPRKWREEKGLKRIVLYAGHSRAKLGFASLFNFPNPLFPLFPLLLLFFFSHFFCSSLYFLPPLLLFFFSLLFCSPSFLFLFSSFSSLALAINPPFFILPSLVFFPPCSILRFFSLPHLNSSSPSHLFILFSNKNGNVILCCPSI